MSTDTEAIPQTYDAAVETMARWHGEYSEPDLEIFSFPDPNGKVVRFIEVSDTFRQSDDVLPVTFGRSTMFPFATSVALVKRDKWERIVAGEMSAPPGWDSARPIRVWPRDGA